MDEIFKKFYSRMKREGILKSALCAIAISFAVVAVTAFICWMTEFTAVWICPVTFAISAGVSFVLFYFLLFRPDFKKTAARMDALGLDERIITMHEFAGSSSPISNMQRADAVQSAGKVGAKMLKFCVPAVIIACAAVGVALGATFVTVDVLAETGTIRSGRQIAADIANPPAEYTLKYDVAGEGAFLKPDDPTEEDSEESSFFSARDYALTYRITTDGTVYSFRNINGPTVDKLEFTVVSGENGEQVRAVPTEGWFLAGWKVNGSNYVMSDDYRQDGNVTKSLTVTAVYEKLEEPEEEEAPSLQGGGGGNGSGSGSGGGQGSGTDRKEADNIINGATNYGDTYAQDLANAMQNVSASDSISQGESDIIGDFFDTIAP